MIYENALKFGYCFNDIHLCKTCEYGMPLIDKDYLTTGDYHGCEYAYKPGFVTQDNGGGYWVTGCAYYKKATIDYYQYLRTKTWREKANERLKRDGYQCVLCRSAKNLSVHHITYENIGFEKIDDLISVCKGCHEKLHEHDSIRPERMELEMDLRPLIYLSKDRSMPFAAYDELTPEGKRILEALKVVKNGPASQDLINKIKSLGEMESTLLLNQLARIGRGNQWNVDTVCAAIHITEAYPSIGDKLALALGEIPTKSIKPAMVALIKEKEWAKGLLDKWQNDPETPAATKNAILLPRSRNWQTRARK